MPPRGDTSVMAIRVMTTNVLAPDQARWDRRRAVLQAEFARLNPDVLAIQEVASAGFLDPRYTVAWHSRRSADGVGAALASRWPLGEVGEVDLHVTDRTAGFPWAAAVVAEVLAPVPFFFAHHKPSWPLPYAFPTPTKGNCKPSAAPGTSKNGWPAGTCT